VLPALDTAGDATAPGMLCGDEGPLGDESSIASKTVMIAPARSPVALLGLCVLGLALVSSRAHAQQEQPQEQQQEEPQDQPERPTVVEEVTVIGVTPLDSAGVDADKFPGSVQTMQAEEIGRFRPRDLGDLLQRGFGGVHVVEAQSNPFQPDVHFRGYSASPLLGSPQGLSVYQDGVRLNELFGDTVHWDLVPQSAVSSIQLVSGSNPLYGLNTLGGTISIRTKSGLTHRSHGMVAEAGSFGQRRLSLESGGHRNGFGYYGSGSLLSEDGWRDFSPSRVRRLFGKLSWQGQSTAIDASVTGAGNRLQGNGAAPVELLDADRSAVFTHPDITDNALILASVGARHALAEGTVLEARGYFRRNDIDTLNADTADFEPCTAAAASGFVCFDDNGEQVGLDAAGSPVPVSVGALDAINNTSETLQRGYGGTLQATVQRDLRGRDNQMILGLSYDAGSTRFRSESELATLTPDRSAQGHGIVWWDSLVGVSSRSRNLGAFVTDTLTVVPRISITLSGRYNDTGIELIDERGDDLNGDHSFRRLNLSIGMTAQLSSRLTAFGGYAESSRAPTPVELTCADPEAPCRLPNAFLADPPLDQVVTRTWEGGLRSRFPGLQLRAVVFGSVNSDDILFISSGPLRGQGFFNNVGKTQRLGFELGASGQVAGRLRWFFEYMVLRPTFGTALTVLSPDHPLAVGGETRVRAGDTIPGVPRHNLKVGLSVAVDEALDFALDLAATSERYLRGDEANLLAPLPGFTVVNAMGSYDLRQNVTLYAAVRNLFDVEYATFGVLGDPGEVFEGRFDDPRFVGPGAPRSFRVGLEWTSAR